ncbi:hypothetical protein [Microbispora rosea]|uniref:hypothetical protein n=1 Tax=Microbispora rosea TaxID=58117 RepID=UPI003413440D
MQWPPVDEGVEQARPGVFSGVESGMRGHVELRVAEADPEPRLLRPCSMTAGGPLDPLRPAVSWELVFDPL